MRTVKVIVIVLIIGVASITARQLILNHRSNVGSGNLSKPGVANNKLGGIISSIPRSENGKYDLGDIALLDNGEAWAVGYDGEHIKRVYHSRDRGRTWDAVGVPGNDFTLKAISFPDSQHGWAVGGNGLIIRTINGGKSWELMEPPTTLDLQAVQFINPQVGYIAGRNAQLNRSTDEVSGSFEILCTNDSGATWQHCYKEDEPSNVFQIAASSETATLVLLNGNRVIRTEDQGKSWQKVSMPVEHIYSIAFGPDGASWIASKQGIYQHSDLDGGKWQQPVSLISNMMNKNWNAIGFNDTGIGLAVGDNGTFALTRDNGNTWDFQNMVTSENLRAIRLRGSCALILGSQNVYFVTL